MTADVLNVGLIGAGLAVRDLHVPALRELGTRVAVTGVAAAHIESASSLVDHLRSEAFGSGAKPVSVRELLGDPKIDAVLVAVPIAKTAEVVEQSLLAGKHVLAEKPLADTVARAVELMELADREGRALAVGENFRFQPDFAKIGALARNGHIGTPLLYFLNDLHFTPRDGKYAATHWRQHGEHRGGYLVDGGTHIVAGMRSMVGTPLSDVHALAASSQPDYLSQQPDVALINLQFADGLVGHLALGYGVFDLEARHPKIYGDSGTLALMPESIQLWNESGSTDLAQRDKRPGFVEEWDAFLGAVSGHRPWKSLVRESIVDLAVIEAAILSSSKGKPVALSDVCDLPFE